ncbi:hypothetical protein [Veillonella caviae]|uniref:hypothetical protein n=1 Tax=Veillonella caviae TaxID=248316 RepID=UPI0023A87A5D|nr:hypothetical protein [Veillonella caviae]MCI5708959.1 hypothetical protein [Veillonella caviae]MCI6407670.1 hypothetical protein [Veillonella caviae]MDY5714964.1 hypothetical protein [Veillonella caviae]MDY6225798.1 hypothetical protein [Veillonella caviae]
MAKENNEKLFTQSEVDSIVRERLERERKRYTGDNEMIETLQSELTAVRTELNSIKADNEAKVQALKAEQVHKSIISELEKVNGIDPTELSKLFLGGASVADSGEVVYTDDTGKSVPINEHIKSWADKSPWAIRTMQNAGSGAGAGIPASKTEMDMRKAFDLD